MSDPCTCAVDKRDKWTWEEIEHAMLAQSLTSFTASNFGSTEESGRLWTRSAFILGVRRLLRREPQ